MNWHQKILMAVAAFLLAAGSAAAQSPAPAPTATLTGVIRDSAGGPRKTVCISRSGRLGSFLEIYLPFTEFKSSGRRASLCALGMTEW